jgi:hypothetical protein
VGITVTSANLDPRAALRERAAALSSRYRSDLGRLERAAEALRLEHTAEARALTEAILARRAGR